MGGGTSVEEVINSLIESQALIRENGVWKVTRPITESEISSTIHGVIAGRLDRLERETKRIFFPKFLNSCNR